MKAKKSTKNVCIQLYAVAYKLFSWFQTAKNQEQLTFFFLYVIETSGWRSVFPWLLTKLSFCILFFHRRDYDGQKAVAVV